MAIHTSTVIHIELERDGLKSRHITFRICFDQHMKSGEKFTEVWKKSNNSGWRGNCSRMESSNKSLEKVRAQGFGNRNDFKKKQQQKKNLYQMEKLLWGISCKAR